VCLCACYLELCLQCKTQEEIANETNITQGRVAQIIEDIKNSISGKINIPESLQLYNVWSFANRDPLA